MDLTTIATALGGIKTATDIARALKDIDGSLQTAELKLKVAELIEALAEAKMSVVNVREQLEAKEEEIQRLIKTKEIQGTIKYESPYYWISGSGSDRDGPFCQKCYDTEQALIRLQNNGSQGHWKCLACGSAVKDSTYRSPGPIQVRRG